MARSKGWFWLATRPALSWTWSLAGGACDFAPAGTWLAATPQSEWPEEVDAAEAEASFDPLYGDRLNELVLIGIDMKREELERRLHEALVPESELGGFASPGDLADPFPALPATVA